MTVQLFSYIYIVLVDRFYCQL